MKYIVIRKAVLMEDEGREHIIDVFYTEDDAKQCIEEETRRDTGYFRRSDFYIATVQ